MGDGDASDRPPNRLSEASSPYLRQHAHNPVDWYPWGPEAFEKARAEDRPIFLSIGYATCHWCHVMAHESFEDPAVAALLNEAFVCVKLDREERPDVDAVYMTVCQLMTGQGGWPLTVALTPDLRPFFAGTYFPRESRHGRIGMLELVPRLAGLWRGRRADLDASADAAVAAIREVEARTATSAGGEVGEEALRKGYDELAARFDGSQGGFGRAPKFPTPHQLLFLLRWHERSGHPEPLAMVEKTLTMMRRGGIFDHVGFGFHRYSTDARWLVPHFEKMLYDQALLVLACVETWEVTRTPRYRRIADEVLEYVARDLTDPEGGFYSAEDADSEGREGAFYVWTREAFDRVLEESLDAGDAAFARRVFSVEGRGNFAEEATGKMTGENILHRRQSIGDIADESGLSEAEAGERIERIRKALFEARERRPRPLLDDKILTDWNGLMIAAAARAGAAFREPRHIHMARAAATFVLDRMRVDGRLLHRYRDGEVGLAACAPDLAYLAWGLIELYGATFEPRWLEAAGELLDELVAEFGDEVRGGVFTSAAGADDVLVRQREVHDGATPSANAVAWYALQRLGQLTGSQERIARARAVGRSLAGPLGRSPSAHTMSLVALDLELGPASEVVIAGVGPDVVGDADGEALLSAVFDRFRPRVSVLVKPAESAAAARVEALAPFTAGLDGLDGKPAAYVCTGFVCRRPTTDPEEVAAFLD